MNGMDESQLAAEIEGMKDDPDAWGEPEAAPAQPARSERRQRGSVVSVRLTVDELARLQAYADERGQSLSGALRAAMLEAADRVAKIATSVRWIGASAASNENINAKQVASDVRSNFYAARAG